MDLPMAYRWEVTRRHPYYLRFWEAAHRGHCGPRGDPTQRAQEEAAVLILLGIGVCGDPPSPGSDPESLGAGTLSQAWEAGAVAPVTFRGLINMLLVGLPPEARKEIGAFLFASAAPVEDAKAQRYEFLTGLQRLRHPWLDAFPSGPVVGINLNAPQRVITAAVEQLVRQWKDERGIGERRRRDDKLEDYLVAWDLREGWSGHQYDGSRERSLREIAGQLGIPLSTAANRYRAAFRLIVGWDYSPPLWGRLLGFLKLSAWVDPAALPKRAGGRPVRNRQPRLVPEAVVQPRHREGSSSILDLCVTSATETALVDLVLDIQELLARGHSNDQIAAKLELAGPRAVEMVDYFRHRHAENL
jgi:hypothetical protein